MNSMCFSYLYLSLWERGGATTVEAQELLWLYAHKSLLPGQGTIWDVGDLIQVGSVQGKHHTLSAITPASFFIYHMLSFRLQNNF